MTDWKQLQADLLAVFERYGVNVAVGLKPDGGVTIRSQDANVDAATLGTVRAQSAR